MKAINYIARIRSLLELVLIKKNLQKLVLDVVYVLNFIEEKLVERLCNSTLITAGVLTFVTMEKAVEVLPVKLGVFGC